MWCHFACLCALVQNLGKAQGWTCISANGGGARKKRWLERDFLTAWYWYVTDAWHRFDALGHRRTARLREALRAWKSPLHWAQVSHCLSETLCIELKYASGCCHLFLHSFEQNLRYDSNKALLADQWYYILYFVSWSASLNQRKRHHRKGACCWQRQGKLWGSMSIRRGASASWAYIFFYTLIHRPQGSVLDNC